MWDQLDVSQKNVSPVLNRKQTRNQNDAAQQKRPTLCEGPCVSQQQKRRGGNWLDPEYIALGSASYRTGAGPFACKEAGKNPRDRERGYMHVLNSRVCRRQFSPKTQSRPEFFFSGGLASGPPLGGQWGTHGGSRRSESLAMHRYFQYCNLIRKSRHMSVERTGQCYSRNISKDISKPQKWYVQLPQRREHGNGNDATKNQVVKLKSTIERDEKSVRKQLLVGNKEQYSI